MEETLKTILEEIKGINGRLGGFETRFDALEAGQKELYQLTRSIEDLSRTTAAGLKRLEDKVQAQNEYIRQSLSKDDLDLFVLQREVAKLSLAYHREQVDKEQSLKEQISKEQSQK